MMAQQRDLFGAAPPAPFHRATRGASRDATMAAAETVREALAEARVTLGRTSPQGVT